MRTVFSKIFRWVVGIIAVLFVILALLPTLISTEWGTGVTLSLINKSIPGEIAVDKLRVSWVGSQKTEGFVLRGSEGQEIFTVESQETTASLISILFGNYGKTTLLNPHLNVFEFKDGESNVEKALSKSDEPKKKKKKRKGWPRFNGEVSVVGGEVSIDAPQIEPIQLKDVSIEWGGDVFHVNAKTVQGALAGSVSASGTFDEKIHVLAQVTNFPVALIDQLEGTKLYSSALGSSLSLELDLLKDENEATGSGTLTTPNLTASFKGSTEEGQFVLDPSSRAVFTVTPAFFGQAFKAAQAEGWALAGKTELTIAIEKLVLPLSIDKHDWRTLPLAAKVSLDRAELSHEKAGMLSLNKMAGEVFTDGGALHIAYAGEVQGKGARSAIKGETVFQGDGKVGFALESTAFPTQLLVLLTDDARYLEKVLGSNVDFSLGGTYTQGLLQGGVKIASSRLQVEGTVQGKLADFKIALAGKVEFDAKESATFGPSPTVEIEAEGSIKKRQFAIPHVRVHLESPVLDFSLKGQLGQKGTPFAFEQIYLSGLGTVREWKLDSDVVIESGSVSLSIDGGKNLAKGKVTLSTKIGEGAETRSLEGEVKAHNFIEEGHLSFEKAEIHAKGNFSQFPVALFTPFAGDLTPLIGPSIDLKVDGAYSPGQAPLATLDIEGKATEFEMRLSVAFDEQFQVKQRKPAFARWEMTPDRYQALMRFFYPDQDPDFLLMRPSQVTLKISQFSLPSAFKGRASEFLCQSGFVGKVESGAMLFSNRKTGEQLILQEVLAAIEGENFSKAIQVSATGKIKSPTTPAGEEAGFAFDGQMLNFWNADCKFNRKNLTVKGELSLDYVPVKAITSILPMDKASRRYTQALLGELVNARLYGEISSLTGPLTVDIKSSNFKALLPLRLGEGYLTLEKAVEAELTLTPEVNEVLLVDVNPLLITGAWSSNPIRLYVDAEGFAIPLHDYSLKKVRVKTAVIDLGKIRVRNGGDIQALMQFLKAKDVTPEGEMEAWFTPIYLSLEDGNARYKRFDALLGGNIHIALWGKVDLVKDKVKMTLGIGASTLEQRFKIKGLSDKNMFQLKMRGKTSNVELDWSSAYTRIGIILTRASGGLGNIVGSILEQIANVFGEEPPPPPTTYPLPWKADHSPTSSKEYPARKRHR